MPVANCHTGACCEDTENSSQQQMSIILFRYADSLHLLGLFICLQIVFLGLQVFNHVFVCIKFFGRLHRNEEEKGNQYF